MFFNYKFQDLTYNSYWKICTLLYPIFQGAPLSLYLRGGVGDPPQYYDHLKACEKCGQSMLFILPNLKKRYMGVHF